MRAPTLTPTATAGGVNGDAVASAITPAVAVSPIPAVFNDGTNNSAAMLIILMHHWSRFDKSPSSGGLVSLEVVFVSAASSSSSSPSSPSIKCKCLYLCHLHCIVG